MAIQDRMNLFLKVKQLTARDLERICNLGNGTATSLTDNTRESTFYKISKGFPDLNIDWLRTGEGNMLKENISITNSMISENSKSSYANNSHNTTPITCENQSEVFTKALDEIAAQRKMTERMLTLVEDTTRKLLDYIPPKQQ